MSAQNVDDAGFMLLLATERIRLRPGQLPGENVRQAAKCSNASKCVRALRTWRIFVGVLGRKQTPISSIPERGMLPQPSK
jgi:hypothetical protein